MSHALCFEYHIIHQREVCTGLQTGSHTPSFPLRSTDSVPFHTLGTNTCYHADLKKMVVFKLHHYSTSKNGLVTVNLFHA